MQLKNTEMPLNTHNNGYYHKDVKQRMSVRIRKKYVSLYIAVKKLVQLF